MMLDKNKKSDYTVEVYKIDRRCKGGEKLVCKRDYTDVFPWQAEQPMYIEYNPKKHRFAVFETFVEATNAMSGETFTERYDTPYYASPRSETYWSR